MTTEEIVDAARAAGFSASEMMTRLAAFKRLIESTAAVEREACAKVCDSLVDLVEAEKAKLRIDYARTAGDEEDELRAMRHELTVSTFNAGISKCAAAIRARSNK